MFGSCCRRPGSFCHNIDDIFYPKTQILESTRPSMNGTNKDRPGANPGTAVICEKLKNTEPSVNRTASQDEKNLHRLDVFDDTRADTRVPMFDNGVNCSQTD